MADKDVSLLIDTADQFMKAIDKKMDGLRIDGKVRSRVFNGMLHLSLEHFGSIILLMKNRMSGSAAALLRPQYESVMRGLYFHECATDTEVDSFIKAKEPIKLYKMVEQVENQLAVNKNPLTNFYNMFKKKMHGFTHGGFEQLKRRYTDTELINNYTEEECIQIVTLSYILAIFSATLTTAVAGREDLAKEFLNEITKLKN